MAYCTHCGSAVEEGARFCPQCGRDVTAKAAEGASGAVPPPAAGKPLESNVAGMLCYVLGFITGLIFLLLAPYNADRFVRFHAFQSIFLNVALIALSFVIGFLPVINVILTPILWLGAFALWIFLLLQAYQGKRWKIPVIGDFAEQQSG